MYVASVDGMCRVDDGCGGVGAAGKRWLIHAGEAGFVEFFVQQFFAIQFSANQFRAEWIFTRESGAGERVARFGEPAAGGFFVEGHDFSRRPSAEYACLCAECA